MRFGRLSKAEKLIIGYIEKNFTDSDGDLDEEIEERIDMLQQALQEAGLTIEDLAENLDILMISTYSDFDEILEYIRRKVISIKNRKTKIACILESYNIIENQKQDTVEQIIKILQQHGLEDIIGYKKENRQIIYITTPEKIKENLSYLVKLGNYRSLVRNNPELLYKSSVTELKKIIEEQNKQVETVVDLNNEEDKYESTDNESDLEKNNKEEKQDQEDNYQDSENTLNQQEEVIYEYLGEEPEILKLKEIFMFFCIPISVLTNNPQICHRVTKTADVDKIRQLKSIKSILKILDRNSISLSIIERCPEILANGSKGKIEAIIKELGEQHLSLDLIYVCPEILLKSSPEKIYKIINSLMQAGIDKNLIYSCPQILISGDTKILINISKDISNMAPDINIILDVAPYVFVKEVQDMYKKYDNTIDIDITKKILSENKRILFIKDLEKSQQNIDLVRNEGLDISIIKNYNQILVLGQKDEMKRVIDKIRSYNFEDEFIENNPIVLLATSDSIISITDKIKQNRPNTYNQIIDQIPNIYSKTTDDKVQKIFETIEDLGMKYKVIDEEPRILLREDTQEIGAVVNNLVQEHNVTIAQIEECPRILSEGKEKYIDRNYETFKLNELSIPFGVIYVKSARNNEKNIDTLIENGLYGYIENNPEILDLEHAKVVQFIKVAKQEDIPLVVRDSNKKKVLNMQYFGLSEEEVSKEYGISIEEIKKARENIDKNPPRRVKNPELYMAVLPQFFDQADKVLDEYKNDDVSYKKYEQVVSKQKVVREAYIDLERASIRTYNGAYAKAKEEGLSDDKASKIAKREARALIQISVINKQLDKTLERLTKRIEADEESIRKKTEKKDEKTQQRGSKLRKKQNTKNKEEGSINEKDKEMEE